MKRSTLTALLATTVIGVSAAGYAVFSHPSEATAKSEAAKTEAKADDYVVVSYKGGEIRKQELDRMWANMFPGEDAPDYESFDDRVKAEILKNIARERLVLEKAYAKKIDTTNEVKEQVGHMTRQVVIQVYLKSILDEIVPEKDIRKEYDVMKEKFVGREEVKASHILVEDEEDAKEIAKQLKDGADFAELAKEKSIDTASGENGGDLGYFTKDRMVPEFADMAFTTKKGATSAPVKSDFGWHIIKVEDKRPVQPPKYEEVRERIQQSLAAPAIERYIANLEKQSDIKLYNEDGTVLTPAQ